MNGISVMISIELFTAIAGDPNRPGNISPEDWVNARLWEYLQRGE